MFVRLGWGRWRLEGQLTLDIVSVLAESTADCCGSSGTLAVALRERIPVTFVSGTGGREIAVAYYG
jgi:hypothetical protein